MVEIEVRGTTVTIHVVGGHRLLSMRDSITFDFHDIAAVAPASVDMRPPWVRAPGAFFPGVIAAGTFRGKGRKEFWDTRFDGSGLQIDLEHGEFTRLVVDVDDPGSALLELCRAAAA
ncbi:hypothetical protein IU449_25255 [Nocardia higoensis]|uniref:Uncharacterized protein n=1 Tax=Nocardia higoensis TaxID=228599 RepID=A0ABS0DL99_9NOCA|nr:hypothetical protein [Nocardia higoensis]MBF6357809.1 hypothetical protein [Nocardia higoensis]